jgi:hypothetical protein
MHLSKAALKGALVKKYSSVAIPPKQSVETSTYKQVGLIGTAAKVRATPTTAHTACSTSSSVGADASFFPPAGGKSSTAARCTSKAAVCGLRARARGRAERVACLRARDRDGIQRPDSADGTSRPWLTIAPRAHTHHPSYQNKLKEERKRLAASFNRNTLPQDHFEKRQKKIEQIKQVWDLFTKDYEENADNRG